MTTNPCTCASGLRCTNAERLWRERAAALEQYQRRMGNENLRAYQSADAAYQRHVAAAQTKKEKAR